MDKYDIYSKDSTLYKTSYIGEEGHMNPEKYDRSTFKSVSEKAYVFSSKRRLFSLN